MAHRGKLAVWAMFLHSKQQKSYQGTLGTLEFTQNKSRTHLGPSLDPTRPLERISYSSSLFQGVYTISTLYIIYLPLQPFWNTFLIIVSCGSGDPP